MELESGGWGEIQYFFTNEAHSALAVIISLTVQHQSTVCNSRLARFIVAVRKSTEVIVKPVEDIIRKCVLIDIQDADMLYVCRIPNFIESD